MLMLRNPPGKNESKMLVNQGTVKYVNYNSGESPDEENNPQTKPVEMVPWWDYVQWWNWNTKKTNKHVA